ncbi:MAG: hypothetical protein EHM72_11975 [Calditrichaeota bacterium]|nr:MAG: hypothetical protein EHM72_11975 [Calditrichota bacterium]
MNILIDITMGILASSFELLKEMAIYLLFGFLVAGILNEFISAEKIARHLGKNNFSAVFKAAVFGIPLPLCSCGVIPPTIALRKAGAGNGAVLSFLIATPTSGVDSIAATYSLLGPFFAAYRVLSSFVVAIFTGSLANIFKVSRSENQEQNNPSIPIEKASIGRRIERVFHFGFIQLISEIGKWLVIGVIFGGIITYFLPDNFFNETIKPGIATILLMVVISVPLYVCATGSIPIAAALMLKGLNPGAAFVLLLAGPATNSVTITVISRFLGKKLTAIYLGALIISSIGLGLLLDSLWKHFNLQFTFAHHHNHQLLPDWLAWSSAVILILLLIIPKIYKTIKNSPSRIDESKGIENLHSTLSVPNMTCNNCVIHVKKAVEQVNGVEQVIVDLKTKKVDILHNERASHAAMIAAVHDAGYQVENFIHAE